MNFETLIEQYGYIAILIGTFLEGETVLILGGFLAHRGFLQLDGVILAAFVGSVCGDQLYFLLGRRFGTRMLERRPHWQARVARSRNFLERHPVPLIVGFRFVYGIRAVAPFVIGMSRIPIWKFAVLNIIGAAVWSAAFGTAGYLFGTALQLALTGIKHYELPIVLAILAVGLVVRLVYRLKNRPR